MHRDTEHAGRSLFNLAVDDFDASITVDLSLVRPKIR